MQTPFLNHLLKEREAAEFLYTFFGKIAQGRHDSTNSSIQQLIDEELNKISVHIKNSDRYVWTVRLLEELSISLKNGGKLIPGSIGFNYFHLAFLNFGLKTHSLEIVFSEFCRGEIQELIFSDSTYVLLYALEKALNAGFDPLKSLEAFITLLWDLNPCDELLFFLVREISVVHPKLLQFESLWKSLVSFQKAFGAFEHMVFHSVMQGLRDDPVGLIPHIKSWREEILRAYAQEGLIDKPFPYE